MRSCAPPVSSRRDNLTRDFQGGIHGSSVDQMLLNRGHAKPMLSPDEKFLMVDVNFDDRPSTNPDGTPKFVLANAPDPDGLVIFPVGGDGALGLPSFHDAGGAAP